MTVNLQQKVAALTATVVVAASVVSTSLAISDQKRHIEQRIEARGLALSEALSRSAAEGMATENLDVIRSTDAIVATPDVRFAQILNTVWIGIEAVPADRLTERPDPEAISYFAANTGTDVHHISRTAEWMDFYHAVAFTPHDSRIRPILLGYVRIRISTAEISNLTADTLRQSILASALLTVLSVLILNVFIGRYVVNPIVRLQTAVSRHRQDEFPGPVAVESHDEVGELSAEFNRMIAALREREVRLSEEKERLAVTLRSIGDAVIVTDLESRITLFNRMAEQLTGLAPSAAIGVRLREAMPLLHERTRVPLENPLYSALAAGLPTSLTAPAFLVRKDGSEILIEDSAAPIRDQQSRIIGAVIVFRDVTVRRRLEQELVKSEKIQSLGVLAGGLAHDFNNLLTAVLGHVSMAKLELGPASDAYSWLVDAESAAQRATGLTKQLLTFARGGAPVRKTASLVALVKESVSLTLSGRNVASRFHIADSAWPADIDEGQISQVFNNLLLNAVQAMPTGGTISVSMDNVTLAENELPGIRSGPYVRIGISDTGVGIPESHLAKIFDPYFTTKQLGSGLGLSSVYSIVSRHEGHVTVSSVQGQGTTFTVYLPATPGAAIPERSRDGDPVAGRARILVMDDEEAVRKVLGAILGRLGYEVEHATDGQQALDAYARARTEARPFDVVIMDLTIPAGMGGLEAVQRLRQIDATATVIVSSGYSNDPVMAEYEKHGFNGVITKPYTADGLSRLVQSVLSDRAPRAAAQGPTPSP